MLQRYNGIIAGKLQPQTVIYLLFETELLSNTLKTKVEAHWHNAILLPQAMLQRFLESNAPLLNAQSTRCILQLQDLASNQTTVSLTHSVQKVDYPSPVLHFYATVYFTLEPVVQGNDNRVWRPFSSNPGCGISYPLM